MASLSVSTFESLFSYGSVGMWARRPARQFLAHVEFSTYFPVKIRHYFLKRNLQRSHWWTASFFSLACSQLAVAEPAEPDICAFSSEYEHFPGHWARTRSAANRPTDRHNRHPCRWRNSRGDSRCCRRSRTSSQSERTRRIVGSSSPCRSGPSLRWSTWRRRVLTSITTAHKI